FFVSSRRRHTRFSRDWSSDVCSSDLHLITDRSDARRDKPEYQQLVHYFCHQQQHGAKGATVEKSVIRRETPFEPDALKGARPVLRGGRRGNVPALPN